MTLTFALHSYGSEYSYNDFYDQVHGTYDEEETDDWLRDPHPRRGDVKIDLTSPSGTTSTLLPYRDYDFVNAEGYDDWPFMSLHFWGEDPVGTWTLHTAYRSSSGHVALKDIAVTLYGVGEAPLSVLSIPPSCHPSCARGCSGDGPQNCDVCRNLRLASTLECVDQCPNGTHPFRKYCVSDSDVEDEQTVCETQERRDDEILFKVLTGAAAVMLLISFITLMIVARVVHHKRVNSHNRFKRLFNVPTSTNSV